MAKRDLFNNIYKLYTEDLDRSHLERLIKTEAPEVYQFYLNSLKNKNYESYNKGERIFIFAKDLAVAFLLKLNPVRRIAYSLAIVIFFYAAFINNWMWASFSFLVMNLLLAFELAGKLSAADELEVAAKIQAKLTKVDIPDFKKIEFARFIKSAREVGGDYLSMHTPEKDDGRRHYIVMGDISGKGMAAAIYMIQVHALLKYFTLRLENLKQTFISLNDIVKKLFDKGIFFTAIGVTIENEEKISVIRAGHSPFLHYCCETGECNEVVPRGIGLGMNDNGLFSKTIEEFKADLKHGDLFVFFTDGVTETKNKFNEDFGTDRLKNIIRKAKDKNVNDILDSILYNVQIFKETAELDDDLSLMIIKVKTEKEKSDEAGSDIKVETTQEETAEAESKI